jgi:two-component sensor histidine kinase/DNA-binding NarL/FixJ family response regulator
MVVNILMVDDRPDNLLALEAVLEDPRYTLVKASSGLEAIAKLETADFTIILLDVQMPQMDGFETARRIKWDPRFRDIPIIFITAISRDPVHVFRGYDSGAIDYILKPLDDYVLRSKVRVLADLYEKNQQIIAQQRALTDTNGELQKEIRDRQHAEAGLRLAHTELEMRVRERTAALAASNDALQLEIVERRRAEEQLHASLKEKEVLLQEIHHRVKNNLQIVCSLLSLQADEIKDAQVLELFQESQDRIRSMALVHEKLYQSGNLGMVDMEGYILGLTNNLQHTYGLLSRAIDIAIDVQEGAFGIDVAIPCGLMLNELLSNAMKHAFPNGRQGRIKVRLRPGKSGWFSLTVQDDGVGIPADLDIHQSATLGLRIVTALVEQLDGKLELDRAAGTTFKIAFPTANRRAPAIPQEMLR